MQQILGFYSVGGGVPEVSDTMWRRAVLKSVERIDPFLGRPRGLPTWTAEAEGDLGAKAPVFREIDLRTDDAWVACRSILAAREAALHEGIVVELWALVVGDDEAQSSWVPTWISVDGYRQLLRFPDRVTRWIDGATSSDVLVVMDRWRKLPYLTSAGGMAASVVGETLIRMLRPLARVAVENSGAVIVHTGGYVLT